MSFSGWVQVKFLPFTLMEETKKKPTIVSVNMCSMSFSTFKVYSSIITCFAFNCPCWILHFRHMSTNLVSIKCIWHYGEYEQKKNPIVKWRICFFKVWSNKNTIFQVRKWFWNNKKKKSKQTKMIYNRDTLRIPIWINNTKV